MELPTPRLSSEERQEEGPEGRYRRRTAEKAAAKKDRVSGDV